MGQRSAELVSAIMTRVTSRDTTPELALRRALWRRGLRYRVHVKGMPGKPDIVFASARTTVFIDGDFWHGNQWKLRGFPTLEAQFAGVSNRNYWIAKVTRNIRRDEEVTRQLHEQGWHVVRVWESELNRDLQGCVARITRQMQGVHEENVR